MTGDYVILRLFLIKILHSHTNMVSGLSGQKDTWWGTECSAGLAMMAAAHGHGLSNRLLLFSPPLFALLPRMGSNSQSSCQSFCLQVYPTIPGFSFCCYGQVGGGEVTKAQVKRMLRDLTVDKSLLVGSQETHIRSMCELAWKAWASVSGEKHGLVGTDTRLKKNLVLQLWRGNH